jgi:hypothetical protein
MPIHIHPEFRNLTEREVRAALADPDPNNQVSQAVAQLIKAYTANFATQVERTGGMPESILRLKGASPIEEVAMQLVTTEIRKAVPANQMLAATGRAIHGDNWLAPFANDLVCDEDTVRAWMTGEKPLTAENSVFDLAVNLCQARALWDPADALAAWLKANRQK